MATRKSAIPRSKAKTAYGLLSEIRTLILKEPKRYNQGFWLTRQREDRFPELMDYPACGTIGCVAGWVQQLVAPRKSIMEADETGFRTFRAPVIATNVLGLTETQADELFAGSAAGSTRGQTRQHAIRGAAHIRRFQKKYAQQLKAKKV